MGNQALFVDLPNFYSHLLESDIDDPRLLRDYFLYWLDFDRLAEALTGEFSSVWVFYSGRRFGPRANRIKDEYLEKYIARINSLEGVTARDVNIESKQRELARYQCEECGHQGIAQWESEKGIDASLTVHLFDTMDSWDVAYLLSGDSDFVPAVASLRRRGKIVKGAGFSARSAALVRECYDYVDLRGLFLRDDVFAYRLFSEQGIAHRWLTDEVGARSDKGPLELAFEWQFHPEYPRDPTGHPLKVSDQGLCYCIYLTAQGQMTLDNRLELLEQLRDKYPDRIGEFNTNQGRFQFFINATTWEGVERRLEVLAASLRELPTYETVRSGTGYKAIYKYDPSTGKYERTWERTGF
jgi:uncharacterized LabA/DUF88 family protein